MEKIPILSPDEWVEAAQNTDNGEPLPNLFDGFLPALTKGRAMILGGPRVVKKTTLALQIYRHVLEMGKTGVFISLEMTPADLFERFARQFDSREITEQWIKDYQA